MDILDLITQKLQQQIDREYLIAYEASCEEAHESYYQYGIYKRYYTLYKVDSTFYLETSIGYFDISYSFTAGPSLPEIEDDEEFFRVALDLDLPVTINASLAPADEFA